MSHLTITPPVVPSAPKRQFLPLTFQLTTWESLLPYVEDLLHRPIAEVKDLEQWLIDREEFKAVIGEDIRWRMIKMTCDTNNKEIEQSFAYFIQKIQPKLTEVTQEINQKLLSSPFLKDLEEEKYFVYLRSIRQQVALYHEKNIPLYTKLKLKEKNFGRITGGMTIQLEEEELTLQQASKQLSDQNRNKRKQVYLTINSRRAKERTRLNELFDELLDYRYDIAVNADYPNFRDYQFARLGRFDYTVDDCFDFHHSIAQVILPLVEGIHRRRKKALGVTTLKPWDLEVEVMREKPLQPFQTTAELVAKTVTCLREVKPEFGDYIDTMNQMGHLDLDSRKGKAPGGYNCPLPETGVPFVFMNAVGTVRDLTTMVHESGHAIHSFLSRPLPLTSFKETPSEVSELAAMAMELISMEHWHIFFQDKEELICAKIKQLEKVLLALPWIATIDKFQNWIYTNPKHSTEERKTAWLNIHGEFLSKELDYREVEDAKAYFWQKQLHLFEVPFYYIEYGMAQLGAIAIWKQYKKQPEQALENYSNALKLGYTKPIGDIYEAAGIHFDFSASYVQDLADFLMQELSALYAEMVH